MKNFQVAIRLAGTTPADLIRPGEPKAEWHHVYASPDGDALAEQDFICAVRVLLRNETGQPEYIASTPDHSFTCTRSSYEAAVHGLLRDILAEPRHGKTPSEHAQANPNAGNQHIAAT